MAINLWSQRRCNLRSKFSPTSGGVEKKEAMLDIKIISGLTVFHTYLDGVFWVIKKAQA